MEFLPNDIEMKLLESNHLTKLSDDGGHYILNPQRGCFTRCAQCVNLSEAESVTGDDGAWHYTNECYFCVQRVIDLLGYLEHGIVPQLVISEQKKTRKRELGGIYEAILRSCERRDSQSSPIVDEDVFSDSVE